MRQGIALVGLVLLTLVSVSASAQAPSTARPPPPYFRVGEIPNRVQAPTSREGRLVGAITYSMSMGIGSTNEFADDFGVRGLTVEMRYFLEDQWSIGLMSGWQLIDNKLRETVELDNGALTATQIRYIDLVPLLATAQFYFPAGPVMTPYVGFGVGAFHTRREIDIGYMNVVNKGWHFGLAPEVGVTIDAGDFGVLVSARFNYAFEAGGVPEELFFTFNVGAITF